MNINSILSKDEKGFWSVINYILMLFSISNLLILTIAYKIHPNLQVGTFFYVLYVIMFVFTIFTRIYFLEVVSFVVFVWFASFFTLVCSGWVNHEHLEIVCFFCLFIGVFMQTSMELMNKLYKEQFLIVLALFVSALFSVVLLSLINSYTPSMNLVLTIVLFLLFVFYQIAYLQKNKNAVEGIEMWFSIYLWPLWLVGIGKNTQLKIKDSFMNTMKRRFPSWIVTVIAFFTDVIVFVALVSLTIIILTIYNHLTVYFSGGYMSYGTSYFLLMGLCMMAGIELLKRFRARARLVLLSRIPVAR